MLLCLCLVARGSDAVRAAERCELLLTNGQVVLGDGSPPIAASVAIQDGKIVAVGSELDYLAEMTLDCRGLAIAPGFIDLHTHSDEEIIARDTRANINYLMQGCTTIVTGNCGSGHVQVDDYLDKVDTGGAGTHVAHLLPHGSLRSQVMGKEDRSPTPEELEQMQSLAEQAMKDGAFGMSTGLIYVPGMFAKTDELIAIARRIGQYQGIYVSHIRGEGSSLLRSVEEAITIGRTAGLPIHVSHFKASGKQAWGSLHLAAKMVEEARGAGLKVTADQYPYIASSTSLDATLLPSWARAGGRTALKERLNDAASFAKIRAEVARELQSMNRIQLASFSPRPDWIGKSLDEIAALEKLEPVDVVMEIEKLGGASIVNFGMDEDDVRMAMALPWVATASDGSAKVASALQPHPRSFGTFPRKLGYYAQQQKILSLEAAIRSSSYLPAQILGLTDRGLIRASYAADLAIFDPASFGDRATYDQPYLPPVGLKHVLVRGKLAVYEGIPTGALAGRSLRKPVSVAER
jgi:N-acyl-D-aspartate/D-glutamate deacylase